jgi:hypothetical protein
MKISIDTPELSNALKLLKSLVEPSLVSFTVGKHFTKIVGSNKGNAMSVSIPTKVLESSENTSFSIDANALSTAIARRKHIDLEVGASEVLILSKAYRVELLIQQFDSQVVIPKEVKENKGLKIKQEFLNALQKRLSKIELKPLLSTYDYVPIGIRSTDKGTFVACYDFYQAAFFYDKEMTGKMDFVVPSNTFTSLAREIKDQNYTISITESAVYAYNEVFEISLAIPQSEGEQVKFDDMITLYKGLKELKGSIMLKMKTDRINAMLENASAVYEKDAMFTFSVKGNKCKLELKSSSGKVESLMELEEAAKEDIAFNCDFGFFKALLTKAPPMLELQVIPDRMLLFQNKPIIYMVSLV